MKRSKRCKLALQGKKKVKLERAYGGCLAPRVEEGRGKLRKASGSRKQASIREMSEWGNPTGVVSGHHTE